MIRKIARWNHIKFYLLIFGPLLVIALLIVLEVGTQDHGHSHSVPPVNQETVEKRATKIIARLIKNKQLDES